MKKLKTAYWIFTGLLCVQMLVSAGVYLFNYEMAAGFMDSLGYPRYIIYPLSVAKILGVAAILTKKSELLKQWAYAGFFFNFLLAISAHLAVGDGQQGGAIIAMVLLLGSVVLDRVLFGKKAVRVAEAA